MHCQAMAEWDLDSEILEDVGAFAGLDWSMKSWSDSSIKGYRYWSKGYSLVQNLLSPLEFPYLDTHGAGALHCNNGRKVLVEEPIMEVTN